LLRPFAQVRPEDVQNEIRAVMKLCITGHPHIVQILGNPAKLSNSTYYAIDMEFCEVTLENFVAGERGPIPKKSSIRLHNGTISSEPNALKWHEICTILIHILRGLEFIHKSKELHRDLKPSNGISLAMYILTVVLYSMNSSNWKIADFGFTTEGSSTRIIISKTGRGTQGYRAPEMIGEDDSQFNSRVDIWAFGCILFEVVNSKKAYKDDFQARDSKWYELKIPKIDFHCGNSEQFYPKAIRSTLNPKPGERQSATQLLVDFEAFVDVILRRGSKQAMSTTSEFRSSRPRTSTSNSPPVPRLVPIPLKFPAVPLTPGPGIASPQGFLQTGPKAEVPRKKSSPRGGDYPTPISFPVSVSSGRSSVTAIPLPEPLGLPELGQMYPGNP
jgi:serine/threonine protein kinase